MIATSTSNCSCPTNYLRSRNRCITETLTKGKHLKLVDDAVGPFPIPGVLNAATNMDHRAYLLRIMVLRYRVLSYVKRFDKDINQWDPTSEFNKILMDLKDWETSLPDDLVLSQNTIYIRQGHKKLGSLLAIHIWYHLCFCDIYRIVVPGLSYSMRPEVDAIQVAAPRISSPVFRPCLSVEQYTGDRSF